MVALAWLDHRSSFDHYDTAALRRPRHYRGRASRLRRVFDAMVRRPFSLCLRTRVSDSREKMNKLNIGKEKKRRVLQMLQSVLMSRQRGTKLNYLINQNIGIKRSRKKITRVSE
jgi:hypothetical protein